MIRNIILKKDFAPVKRQGSKYHLMWGAKEMGDYYACNHEFIDNVSVLNIPSLVDEAEKRNYPSISTKELSEWLSVFGNKDIQVEWLRGKILKQLEEYDKSKNVEDFTIGGIHIWLDHNLRGKVKENLESCDKEGITETVLRISGMSFPVTVKDGWAMYYAVLSYARKCWNVTQGHYAAINELKSIEELLSYDFTRGYPEKLVF